MSKSLAVAPSVRSVLCLLIATLIAVPAATGSVINSFNLRQFIESHLGVGNSGRRLVTPMRVTSLLGPYILD